MQANSTAPILTPGKLEAIVLAAYIQEVRR